MAIKKVYAQINCSNLSTSERWYAELFGRAPDARPMEGLVEWHHHESAGLQLFQSKKDAGHNTLTLIVKGLREEHARLEEAGLAPGEIELSSTTSLVRFQDPDGNLIVLAEPGN